MATLALSSDRSLNAMARVAIRAGWQITKTSAGHLKWRWPANGSFFFTASTPGDRRCCANVRAQMRRAERRAAA